MSVVRAGRVVLPSGVRMGALIRCDGERIVAVDTDPDPGRPDTTVVPGLVDVHVHGGGGGSFDGDEASARRAAGYHLARGSTSVVASLVSAPAEQLLRSVALLADLVEERVLAGIHLEGPFLADSRRGAHDAAHLVPPDLDLLAGLLDTGRGHVRQVTIAPELPGALRLIRHLVERGVVAGVGHTDCSFAEAHESFDAGATLVTHLGNAMRPLHHRDPGPVAAALVAPVVCELIADGVHVHDEFVRTVFQLLGPHRIALVTDAMAAAGTGDGTGRVGSQAVEVVDGVARVVGTGVLAGGTTTLAEVLRRALHNGVGLADAVVAATSTPARAVGLRQDVGVIEPGARADLVVLDADLHVVAVMRAGRWLTSPPAGPT